ncbi:hypothetical protein ZWY2020_057092 [Hordeum vulgare]|nr:hypothetical protein ZWY2020_057092 [Hordeum vulgare]
MHEEMSINKVWDITELYAMADRCTRDEEGRRLPGEDAGTEVDSDDDDKVPISKGKGRNHNRKRKGKAVMAIKVTNNSTTGKKAKFEGSGKDVVACSGDDEVVAGDKTGMPYFKINLIKDHDITECC